MSSFTAKQKDLRVTEESVGICWTGQAGFSFKDSGGLTYHVDPFLSNVCSRYVGYHRAIPAPVEAGEMEGDFFLFTHEHRDHLDTDSVPIIAANANNKNAKFIGPPACMTRLLELEINANRLIAIKRGESVKIGNIEVKAVYAEHTDDSVGYILSFSTLKIYITGDTEYSIKLIEIGKEKPEIMICCINGRLGCMNIADAVRLTSHIQPNIAVPMHVNMFIENTASADEYIRQVELHSGITKGFIMEHGAWYNYSRTEGFRKL
jgi:L-ascorbate 6-phosphate lactonase